MSYTFGEQQCRNLEVSTRREWILPNGLGGFAMGTISGINTRRYHGLLVAAVRPPEDRMVLLAGVDAFVQDDGPPIGLSANQYPGAVSPEGYHYLKRFFVNGEAAVWDYAAGELEVRKTLASHPLENATTLTYENTGKKPLLLTLRPFVSHKSYHGNFSARDGYPQQLSFPKDQTVVEDGGISLVLFHPSAQRTPVQGWYYRFEHARETDRGLDPRDDLFCPCELKYELRPGETAVLVASLGEPAKPLLIKPDDKPVAKVGEMLRQAASAYLVSPKERTTIIAGYPWFTDWGRDTMIALPGICLHTGKIAQARDIIDAFTANMHQGLIPNRFVEAGEDPAYNTVDATLWMANAIYKTLEAEWDEAFATRSLAAIESMFDWHMKGTDFGIAVDPADGLLRQGAPGLQLTWMDAKIGDWVVTPRHGKPVEINGLWINALRIAEWLSGKLGKKATAFVKAAKQAEANFETKFWHEKLGFYLDTVDPDDASLRPNQLIAMSLPFSPVDKAHAKRALKVIDRELLTPVGIRTLGPNEPAYKGRYRGPMVELDSAYHQGTVWPWLFGPYASAVVRNGGSKADVKACLKNAKEMLQEFGIGGIAEVYDGDEPHQPNGCPWQAWSVSEILRAWVEDVEGDH